jgi:hypothetical protein
MSRHASLITTYRYISFNYDKKVIFSVYALMMDGTLEIFTSSIVVCEQNLAITEFSSMAKYTGNAEKLNEKNVHERKSFAGGR